MFGLQRFLSHITELHPSDAAIAPIVRNGQRFNLPAPSCFVDDGATGMWAAKVHAARHEIIVVVGGQANANRIDHEFAAGKLKQTDRVRMTAQHERRSTLQLITTSLSPEILASLRNRSS